MRERDIYIYRGGLVLACVRLCESAMHARERRNVSDIASLALLVDIYGRGVEGFNRDSSCVAAATGSTVTLGYGYLPLLLRSNW